jgi:hypothetical protein
MTDATTALFRAHAPVAVAKFAGENKKPGARAVIARRVDRECVAIADLNYQLCQWRQ